MGRHSHARRKPIQPFPQCVDCLTKLSQAMALMADGDGRVKEHMDEEIGRILEEGRESRLNSPQIAHLIQSEIRNLSGVSDPYAKFKEQEMDAARKAASSLGAHVGSDLRSRIVFAVLGNSLDFFKDPGESLSLTPAEMGNGLSFRHDDIDYLERLLSRGPGLVLYLTDNAGEVFFDLPLYDYVRARAGRTVLVVKGGPSLNDLTRGELTRAGLDSRFQEVADTGIGGAGIHWNRVSEDFLNLVEKADLIISKGMANFETIYPEDLTPLVFFLLKAKCPPVQRYLKAPPESLLAFFQEGREERP